MRLKILSLTHIPGKLYPVNFPLLRNMNDLFIENERVVIECEDEKGRTQVLVLVGALNVGKMAITFEESISTNSDNFSTISTSGMMGAIHENFISLAAFGLVGQQCPQASPQRRSLLRLAHECAASSAEPSRRASTSRARAR